MKHCEEQPNVWNHRKNVDTQRLFCP